MRTKLTRAAHGLDSPRDPAISPPCRDDPEAWVLVSSSGNRGVTRLSRLNADALKTCRSCPIVDRCGDEWRRLPAEMRAGFIAGGIVWDRHGQPTVDYRVVP